MHNQFAIRQHATGPVPVAKCIAWGRWAVCVCGTGDLSSISWGARWPPPAFEFECLGGGGRGGVVGVHHRLKAVEELRNFWAGRKEEEELLY
jgi:hypothetical protein